jgi:F-type H+-transporting ATPase subunit delta
MSVVSRRYARALIDTLSPDGPDAIDVGYEQLQAIQKLLDQEPEARELLMNPAIPDESRAGFIASLSELLELKPAVEKLLLLLVDRRRLGILADLIHAYQAISDERRGILRAVVTTVAPLSHLQRQELVQRLEKTTGKRIIVREDQDAGIIGGMVVRVGSTVYDGSLRQHLNGFRHRLLAR